jgi:hypothetical protein
MPGFPGRLRTSEVWERQASGPVLKRLWDQIIRIVSGSSSRSDFLAVLDRLFYFFFPFWFSHALSQLPKLSAFMETSSGLPKSEPAVQRMNL